ncbi:hypothetical protein HDU82_009039 [Entophlyctis luteolus]|nr:hypothetical protein HDU82_009039 [Entophlyctis luteolus]
MSASEFFLNNPNLNCSQPLQVGSVVCIGSPPRQICPVNGNCTIANTTTGNDYEAIQNAVETLSSLFPSLASVLSTYQDFPTDQNLQLVATAIMTYVINNTARIVFDNAVKSDPYWSVWEANHQADRQSHCIALANATAAFNAAKSCFCGVTDANLYCLGLLNAATQQVLSSINLNSEIISRSVKRQVSEKVPYVLDKKWLMEQYQRKKAYNSRKEGAKKRNHACVQEYSASSREYREALRILRARGTSAEDAPPPYSETDPNASSGSTEEFCTTNLAEFFGDFVDSFQSGSNSVDNQCLTANCQFDYIFDVVELDLHINGKACLEDEITENDNVQLDIDVCVSIPGLDQVLQDGLCLDIEITFWPGRGVLEIDPSISILVLNIDFKVYIQMYSPNAPVPSAYCDIVIYLNLWLVSPTLFSVSINAPSCDPSSPATTCPAKPAPQGYGPYKSYYPNWTIYSNNLISPDTGLSLDQMSHLIYAFMTVSYSYEFDSWYLDSTGLWGDFILCVNQEDPSVCFEDPSNYCMPIPVNIQCAPGYVSLVPYFGYNPGDGCPKATSDQCFNVGGDYTSPRTPPCNILIGHPDTSPLPQDKDGNYYMCGEFNYILNEVAQNYQNLRMILSIGGWYDSSMWSVATNDANLPALVASIASWVKFFGWDGIDIDWEYPMWEHANQTIPTSVAPLANPNMDTSGNSDSVLVCDTANEAKCNYPRANDGKQYVNFLQQLRAALDPLQPAKEVSIAAPAGSDKIQLLSSYWVDIFNAVDTINMMSYDLHGSWDAVTDHQAAIIDNMPKEFVSGVSYDIESALAAYAASGIDSSLMKKILLGLPWYSRQETNLALEDDYYSHIDGESIDFHEYPYLYSPKGTIPAPTAMVTYRDIVEDSSWNMAWDQYSQAAYYFNSGLQSFASVDSPYAAYNKACYVHNKTLGGIMTWMMGQDSTDNELFNASRVGLDTTSCFAAPIIKPSFATAEPTVPVCNVVSADQSDTGRSQSDTSSTALDEISAGFAGNSAVVMAAACTLCPTGSNVPISILEQTTVNVQNGDSMVVTAATLNCANSISAGSPSPTIAQLLSSSEFDCSVQELHRVLIDGGFTDIGLSNLQSYVQNNSPATIHVAGVDQQHFFDQVIISHMDRDHVNGVINMLQSPGSYSSTLFKAGTTEFNLINPKCKTSDSLMTLLNLLSSQNHLQINPAEYMSPNSPRNPIILSANVSFQLNFLGPNQEYQQALIDTLCNFNASNASHSLSHWKNALSIVHDVGLIVNGTRVSSSLYTGDAVGENMLFYAGVANTAGSSGISAVDVLNNYPYDFLKAPHHASTVSFSAGFKQYDGNLTGLTDSSNPTSLGNQLSQVFELINSFPKNHIISGDSIQPSLQYMAQVLARNRGIASSDVLVTNFYFTNTPCLQYIDGVCNPITSQLLKAETRRILQGSPSNLAFNVYVLSNTGYLTLPIAVPAAKYGGSTLSTSMYPNTAPVFTGGLQDTLLFSNCQMDGNATFNEIDFFEDPSEINASAPDWSINGSAISARSGIYTGSVITFNVGWRQLVFNSLTYTCENVSLAVPSYSTKLNNGSTVSCFQNYYCSNTSTTSVVLRSTCAMTPAESINSLSYAEFDVYIAASNVGFFVPDQTYEVSGTIGIQETGGAIEIDSQRLVATVDSSSFTCAAQSKSYAFSTNSTVSCTASFICVQS